MTRYFSDDSLLLLLGDAAEQLATVPDRAVNCVVTSPPYYGLRDYGVDGQLGLENTPDEYVTRLVDVFRGVWRALADDGTMWLNLGDSYAKTYTNNGGYSRRSTLRDGQLFDAEKSLLANDMNRPRRVDPGVSLKNLLGMPWRVALALQSTGWVLRNAIVWRKTNALPQSVQDRLSSKYELVFLLCKQSRYWFDLDAIREPSRDTRVRATQTWEDRKAAGEWGSQGLGGLKSVNASVLATHEAGPNPGDVWDIPTQPYSGTHSAPMPLKLATRCVRAGCKPGGTVLDPFCGTGTSLLAAQQTGRRGVGIELNPDYLAQALERCRQPALVEDAR